jgi:hypothetical protein
MVPPTAARTKKKRKKAAALAAPAAASDDTSTATPTPSTAPTTKKGKTPSKKKATEHIDLCTTPMWVKTTNGTRHCIVAITHRQKWVVSNATIINGDGANEPLSGHQWYQKGPYSKIIVPGNMDFTDTLAIEAFLHMMPPEQLVLMLEFTKERLVQSSMRAVQ